MLQALADSRVPPSTALPSKVKQGEGRDSPKARHSQWQAQDGEVRSSLRQCTLGVSPSARLLQLFQLFPSTRPIWPRADVRAGCVSRSWHKPWREPCGKAQVAFSSARVNKGEYQRPEAEQPPLTAPGLKASGWANLLIAPTQNTPSPIHRAEPTCAGGRDSQVSKAGGTASKENLGRQPCARLLLFALKLSAPRSPPPARSDPAPSLEAPPRSFRPCRVGASRAWDQAGCGAC